MRKRQRRSGHYGDAAHIKTNTAGSSNEISFSVLDAKISKMDEGKKEDTEHPLGKISLFTLGSQRSQVPTLDSETVPGKISAPGGYAQGRSGSSGIGALGALGAGKSGDSGSDSGAKVLSPEEEIARRKAKRRRSKRLGIAFVIIVSLALLGVAGYFGYAKWQDNKARVNKMQYALNEIASVDENIVALDDLLENPEGVEDSSKVQEVTKGLNTVEAKLLDAKSLIDSALVDMADNKDKDVANTALDAIAARLQMLEFGGELLELNQQGSNALKLAESAWDSVLKADSLAREAATLVGEYNVENIKSSLAKNEDARSGLQSARGKINQITDAFPEVQMGVYKKYISKRISALDHAIASDQALLDEKPKDAKSENDAYSAADAEAVELAKKLPGDITEPVYAAYNSAMADPLAKYQEARTNAGNADEIIRDYLGTSS